MGGTPLPPFTDKIFGKKGVMDLGGTPPPPFTDKIRKVVFEVLPKEVGGKYVKHKLRLHMSETSCSR